MKSWGVKSSWDWRRCLIGGVVLLSTSSPTQLAEAAPVILQKADSHVENFGARGQTALHRRKSKHSAKKRESARMAREKIEEYLSCTIAIAQSAGGVSCD